MPKRPTEPRLPVHGEDLDLRRRLLAGERQAVELLQERHLGALYEFVHYRLGRDRAATEDVVQDTLLVACDPKVAYDGRSRLHTWLCGIAKNKIRGLRRKLRPVRIEELLDDADSEIDAVLADIEGQPLPEDVLERKETAELVGATLSSLPPDYRDALLGKYVEGKTVPEMAREQGRQVKAAESQLHRARLAFSKVFTLLAKKRGGLAT
jgi:RNA polymerase sigma-70 factor, ECF subfamily